MSLTTDNKIEHLDMIVEYCNLYLNPDTNKPICDYKDNEYVKFIIKILDCIKDDFKLNNCKLRRIKNDIIYIPKKERCGIRCPNKPHQRFMLANFDKNQPIENAIQLYLMSQYWPQLIKEKQAEYGALFYRNGYSPIFFKYILGLFPDSNIKFGNIEKCVIRGDTQDKGIDWIVLIFNYSREKPIFKYAILNYIFEFRKLPANKLIAYKNKTKSNLSISVFGQTKTQTGTKPFDYEMLYTDSGHSLITDSLCMAEYDELIDTNDRDFRFKFNFHHSRMCHLKNRLPARLKISGKTATFEYEEIEDIVGPGKFLVPYPNKDIYNEYLGWLDTQKSKDSLRFMTGFIKEKFKNIENGIAYPEYVDYADYWNAAKWEDLPFDFVF